MTMITRAALPYSPQLFYLAFSALLWVISMNMTANIQVINKFINKQWFSTTGLVNKILAMIQCSYIYVCSSSKIYCLALFALELDEYKMYEQQYFTTASLHTYKPTDYFHLLYNVLIQIKL